MIRKLFIAVTLLLGVIAPATGSTSAHTQVTPPTPAPDLGHATPPIPEPGHGGPALAPSSLNPATTGDASDVYIWRDYATPDPAHPYYLMRDNVLVEQTAKDIFGNDFAGMFYIQDYAFIGDTGFGGYAGPQTKVYNPNVRAYQGRGFIVSVWNSTGVYSTTPGVFSASGTEQGQPYYSLRIVLNWAENHWYRVNTERVTVGCSCIHVTFNDLTTGGFLDLGYIYVPASWGGFINYNLSRRSEEYTPGIQGSGAGYSCPAGLVSKALWGTSIMSRRGLSDVYPNVTPSASYVDNSPGHCGNSYATDLGGGNGDLWRQQVGG